MDIPCIGRTPNSPMHILLIIDILSEHTEPICNYKSCYHKFPEHFLNNHRSVSVSISSKQGCSSITRTGPYIMSAKNLISIATSVGAGFFIGILLGYFVKKIIKILMFVGGGIVLLLLFLEQQQIISVNVKQLEESSTFTLTSMASSFYKMTEIGDATSLVIPLTGALAAGFATGFMKGF